MKFGRITDDDIASAHKRRPAAPPGFEGQSIEIIFGHNASIQRVLMMFGMSADRLIFTPEQARDVAAKLIERANLAEGV